MLLYISYGIYGIFLYSGMKLEPILHTLHRLRRLNCTPLQSLVERILATGWAVFYR